MPSKPISYHLKLNKLDSSLTTTTTASSFTSSSSSIPSSSHIACVEEKVRARLLIRAQHHMNMALNAPPWFFISCMFLCMFSCMVVRSYGITDGDVLFKFKESLANTEAIGTWNDSINPCNGNTSNWVGVICFQGKIWGLQLENMHLRGLIDVDALAGLPLLRTLSFMNNEFDGPLPIMRRLHGLKSLYLSNNRFSGEIPDDAFSGMFWLKKVYLAQNEFTGKIPSSLVRLPKLLDLRLDGNQFEGQIPDFEQKELKTVNFSNNKLEGPIPAGLKDQKPDMFSGNGNGNLCGPPLDMKCPPPGTPPAPLNEKKRPRSNYIIIIIIVVVVVVAVILGCLFFLFYRRRDASQLDRSATLSKSKKMGAGEVSKVEHASPEPRAPGRKADHGKLVFLKDDSERFDLQDLLRASAEVLGSGTFGSSYKAALLTGPVVVVKRYRQMNNVGREDFQEHMRRLGRLRHPNLLSLVAYYYRKEEKLLVSNFVGNGSLAYHLHGNRSPDRPGLDWPMRLKIIKEVAKGLVYLHNELPSMTLPHGHLKSSNVLLNESFQPLLTDYGLVPVINKDHAQQLMIAYKSPEYAQLSRTTKKTDVWSLGILILEILTGKFPENYLKLGKGNSNMDLAKWVNSVVREEWTGEVFDNDMKGTKNGEGEMLKLLKIGLDCCEGDVERRWELKEAADKIEELKERDHDDDFYSSFASEGDLHSRATTEEDISFTMHS